jgi:hypothetical protein
MAGLPPHLAFLLGGLIGVVCYGPAKRWIVTMQWAFRDESERPGAQRDDSRLLLLIFATMHPAPWLFILFAPIALYQLALGPLPLMWLRLIVGIMMGIALILLYDSKWARLLRS